MQLVVVVAVSAGGAVGGGVVCRGSVFWCLDDGPNGLRPLEGLSPMVSLKCPKH